uniref:Ion_trans_2 domain-containing protein n=1 Tax=Heterorhabditis bacteriophora TaxID=37862 RepID=A0A1I7XRS3_HETBA
MFYMLVGSFVFLWLEGSNDERTKREGYHVYKRERELLLRRMEEIISDRAAKRRTLRRRFINEAVDHFEDKVGFQLTNTSQWNLMSAMYYSGTLFTTIGYGDISCVTTAGRIMTVIYSCIGIPLMLITLNDLGKFLYTNINGCVKMDMVERGDTVVIEASSIASEAGSIHSVNELELNEKPPRMSVKVALGITIGWIFFCSALFRLWENWSYGESCYFMYISLSTIGLGDISVTRREYVNF